MLIITKTTKVYPICLVIVSNLAPTMRKKGVKGKRGGGRERECPSAIKLHDGFSRGVAAADPAAKLLSQLP